MEQLEPSVRRELEEARRLHGSDGLETLAGVSMYALLLRNTSVVNMLDGWAISLPCHEAGALPVGLMRAVGGQCGPDGALWEPMPMPGGWRRGEVATREICDE
jgi:hypothetical protein